MKILESDVDGHLKNRIHTFNAIPIFLVWLKLILSNPQQAELEVPQGFIPSPLMYSFHMSNFFEVLQLGVDSLCSVAAYEKIPSKLQNTLRKALTWENTGISGSTLLRTA